MVNAERFGGLVSGLAAAMGEGPRPLGEGVADKVQRGGL